MKDINELLEEHGLVGTGRIVGITAREYTPIATEKLVSDLEKIGFPFDRSVADNPEHPDCGKPILIFTVLH